MSKSYFEQRIFGQKTPDQAPEVAADRPTLTRETAAAIGPIGQPPQPQSAPPTQPASAPQPVQGGAMPSQPYRFGAAARGDHPPITSQAYEQRMQQQQDWSAAEDLRSRIGMSHRERARLERSLQWTPATNAEIEPEGTPHLGQMSDQPYPHQAPQPELSPVTEPTIGLHASNHQEPETAITHTNTASVASTTASVYEDEIAEERPLSETAANPLIYTDAPATTATYATNPGPSPDAAVTEPRLASASGVRAGARVNLSDQRTGTSTVPYLRVRAEDRMGVTSQSQPSSDSAEQPVGVDRTPLALAFLRRQQPGHHQKRRPVAATAAAALATQQAYRREAERVSPFGWLRNGAFALLALFAVGVLLSVSYAGFQRLGSPGEGVGVPLISAPDTPIRLTPAEAGLDPAEAAGRQFGSDLLIMNQPSGDLALSEDRYAAQDQDRPTLQIGFGAAPVPDLLQSTGSQAAVAGRDDPLNDIIQASTRGQTAFATSSVGDPAGGGADRAQPQAPSDLQAQDSRTADSMEAPRLAPGSASSSSNLSSLLDEAEADLAVAGADSPVLARSVSPTPATPALENLTPIANALNDLPGPMTPKLRGTVTLPRQPVAILVQGTPGAPSASLGGGTATVNLFGTETAAASAGGVRGSASAVVAIDPASGQPTTPQAPSLSGAAVVAPFGIQLGALRSEDQARQLWSRLTIQFPGLLGSLSHRVVAYDSGPRGMFYRLQAGPMPTQATAQDFCIQLKRQGQDCLFVRGQS